MPFFYVHRYKDGIPDKESQRVEVATAANAAELVNGAPVVEAVKVVSPLYFHVTAASKPNHKLGFRPAIENNQGGWVNE